MRKMVEPANPTTHRRDITLGKDNAQLAGGNTRAENWFIRRLASIKTVARMLFGLIWVIDGTLKLQPGFVGSFPSLIDSVSTGQPAILHGWFAFWNFLTLANPAMFVYGEATLEFGLGIVLILGLFRKVAYVGGFFLSILIWSVGEGFGGPYNASSTDIGAGAIYAVVFLFLIIINASHGPSKYSLDSLIERRWKAWKKFAEVRVE